MKDLQTRAPQARRANLLIVYGRTVCKNRRTHGFTREKTVARRGHPRKTSSQNERRRHLCRKTRLAAVLHSTPVAARPPTRSTRVRFRVQASSRLPSSTSGRHHNLADCPRPGGRRHGRPAPGGPRARAQRFLRQARGADPRAVLRPGRAEPRVEQVQQDQEREGAGQARGEGKLQEGAPREAPAGRAIDAGEDQEQGARRFRRRGRRRLRLGRVGGRVGGRTERVRLRGRCLRRGK